MSTKKLTAEEYENQHGNWFCTVSSMPTQIEQIKVNIKEFPFWAFIDHQPDKETEESDNHFHTHFMFRSSGSRKIKTVAKTLGVPSHMVQLCRAKRSYGRYFIHKDDPEKIQYSIDDIMTNRLSDFKIWLVDNEDSDVRRLFSDLRKLQKGELTLDNFIDLHYLDLQRMPFYQKIKTYEYIHKIARA